MALFQNSVLKKYLKGLESEKVDTAFDTFSSYFHNPTIQENIRNAKEEQYQEGFLRELFVKILGYTLNPEPDFNLTTEFKNIRGGKKADGAILHDQKAIAVIELKGTNTTNLDKIESQAFGYKNNQPDAIYVITSNFEKIRFYIDNAVDYEEFNLFQLTRQRFSILWLCMAQESIFQNLAKRLKDDSLEEEENVTKKLYKDYSTFKKELFDNIAKRNPDKDQLVLYKKTQKLLDRFLFIFFAEDRLLLPPNSIRKIIDQWVKLRDELDAYTPLYERFKKYFNYLLEGRPKNGHKDEIFAYNGGLFEPDEILDNIQIDDDTLYKHTLNLTHYDYETEVDVNILGHIFEHSLNEIEGITAQLEGREVEKDKTKRKKDGVFYTPKYITKYIVENTVGRLCEEKKQELQLDDIDFSQNFQTQRTRKTKDGKKTRLTAEAEQILKNIEEYRNWLLQITICDPACGSGAFLNQALEFLILEHGKIDEMQTLLMGGGIVFPDVENSILENNLFGVDINEESVEIAQLSLWLRTARKGRKLTSLSNNLKCGNSLINDPEVAGDKAFDWEKEFPQVFEKGGFDVVLGNPPYLRVQGLNEHFPEMMDFYENSYKSASGNFDIYVLFMEKSMALIQKTGLVSFILPHKFLISEFGIGVRSLFLKSRSIESITHFKEHLVFEDATTYTCIISLSNTKRDYFRFRYSTPSDLFDYSNFFDVEYQNLNEERWSLNNPKIKSVLDKLNQQPFKISDYIKVFSGIQTSGDKIYIIEGEEKNGLVTGYSKSLDRVVQIEAAFTRQLVKGNSINRYQALSSRLFVIFPYSIEYSKATPLDEDFISKNYPLGYSYLKQHEEFLRNREKGKMDKEGWFLYIYPKNLVASNQKKLVSPDITLGLQLTKDSKGFCVKDGAYGIKIKNPANQIHESTILAIMNSNLLWFFLKNTGNVLRGGYFRFKTKFIDPFPVIAIEQAGKAFDDKITVILQKNSALELIRTRFCNLIERKFNITKPSKNLLKWYVLTFANFLKELKKNKIKLSLSEEVEWEEYFEVEKAKAQAVQSEIKEIDREIDKIVYELYDLTEEEIAIVESS